MQILQTLQQPFKNWMDIMYKNTKYTTVKILHLSFPLTTLAASKKAIYFQANISEFLKGGKFTHKNIFYTITRLPFQKNFNIVALVAFKYKNNGIPWLI